MNQEATAIYNEIWNRLEQGSRDGSHAFHTPVLGTQSLSGAPDLRTVVLRRVDQSLRLICCHTDSRSPKINEIQANDKVAWLFYDAQARVQVRVHGHCAVHMGPHDPVAKEIWPQVAPQSRVCYAAPQAPSCELDQWESNQASHAREIAATPPTPEDTPPNTFAVLATVIDSIEWLELHHDGHRRLRFICSDDAEPQPQWLAP